jgi:hypothetical protein
MVTAIRLSMTWDYNMNKYIGVLLAFLSVIAIIPRLRLVSEGASLLAPAAFLMWAIGTLCFNYLQGNQKKTPNGRR